MTDEDLAAFVAETDAKILALSAENTALAQELLRTNQSLRALANRVSETISVVETIARRLVAAEDALGCAP